MDYQNLLFEKKNGIGYLTLNRPEKLNALSADLMADLRHALDMIEADADVKVVILTGAGRAFSAGFDIGAKEGEPEIYERSADEWRSHLKQNIDTLLKIWHSGKPYIAAINGYAVGTGSGMALACDLAIAAEHARLGEPEIRHGALSPFLMLPFLTHSRAVHEMYYTGDLIGAGRDIPLIAQDRRLGHGGFPHVIRVSRAVR